MLKHSKEHYKKLIEYYNSERLVRVYFALGKDCVELRLVELFPSSNYQYFELPVTKQKRKSKK